MLYLTRNDYFQEALCVLFCPLQDEELNNGSVCRISNTCIKNGRKTVLWVCGKASKSQMLNFSISCDVAHMADGCGRTVESITGSFLPLAPCLCYTNSRVAESLMIAAEHLRDSHNTHRYHAIGFASVPTPAYIFPCFIFPSKMNLS